MTLRQLLQSIADDEADIKLVARREGMCAIIRGDAGSLTRMIRPDMLDAEVECIDTSEDYFMEVMI